MARSNDSCLGIVGSVVILALIITETFKGNFYPILIIAFIFIAFKVIIWFSNQRKRDLDFKPLFLIIIISGILSIIYANRNFSLKSNSNIKLNDDLPITIKISPKVYIDNETVIEKTEQLYNCSFQIPNSLILNNELSSVNSKNYFNYDSNISLTVNADLINTSDATQSIEYFAVNKNEYAKLFNDNNKSRFSDFELLSSDIVPFANLKAFKLVQSSTEISGKGIKMLITTFNVFAYPYKFSISFSYPKNHPEFEEQLNLISNSFIFKVNEESQTEENVVSNNSTPYYMKNLYFNTGKATFSQQHYPILQSLIAMLKEYPNSTVEIIGIYSEQNEKNIRLTLYRAFGVKNYFIENGIDSKRISKCEENLVSGLDKMDNNSVEIKLFKTE